MWKMSPYVWHVGGVAAAVDVACAVAAAAEIALPCTPNDGVELALSTVHIQMHRCSFRFRFCWLMCLALIVYVLRRWMNTKGRLKVEEGTKKPRCMQAKSSWDLRSGNNEALHNVANFSCMLLLSFRHTLMDFTSLSTNALKHPIHTTIYAFHVWFFFNQTGSFSTFLFTVWLNKTTQCWLRFQFNFFCAVPVLHVIQRIFSSANSCAMLAVKYLENFSNFENV